MNKEYENAIQEIATATEKLRESVPDYEGVGATCLTVAHVVWWQVQTQAALEKAKAEVKEQANNFPFAIVPWNLHGR